jgi:hypothetical protein
VADVADVADMGWMPDEAVAPPRDNRNVGGTQPSREIANAESAGGADASGWAVELDRLRAKFPDLTLNGGRP